MPRLERNETIIIQVTIPKTTLTRANMKNKLLMTTSSVSNSSKKYQLHIEVQYFAL